MEHQLYYRPSDLTTAKYLEERLGMYSAYAYSQTLKDGTAASEGQTERPIPLLTAQEIAQLTDTEVIGFHRNLPPFRLERIDWRNHPLLRERRKLPPPALNQLPKTPDTPIPDTKNQSYDLIDPDDLRN